MTSHVGKGIIYNYVRTGGKKEVLNRRVIPELAIVGKKYHNYKYMDIRSASHMIS